MLKNRMVWCSAALAGAVVLVAVTLSAVAANKADAWKHDFTEAATDAKKSGRPLLVHFSATWCPPCQQMERNVLHTPEVQELLSKHFVAVMIDADTDPDLSTHFKVKSLPTDIAIAPDGVVLWRNERSQDKANYVAQLQQIVRRLPAAEGSSPATSPNDLITQQDKPQESLKGSAKGSAAPSRTDDAGSAKLSDSAGQRTPVRSDTLPNILSRDEKPAVDPKEKLLVGLDRYSPVSLQKQRLWRKGKPEHAFVYQGIVYLMHDAEEAQEFQANPAKFAPKLLGCDPVVLWSDDRAVPGSTQYGAYFDGELYLFSSADNRSRFKENPSSYTRLQHVLKIDDIDGGPRWR